MEGFVPWLAGALAALSVALLLGEPGYDEGRCNDVASACNAMLASLVQMMKSLRAAYALVEDWLCSHGVLTSRKRAERARIERAMPESFSALAVSLGSGLSLAQAMQYVGGRAEEPVRTEFLHASALMTCGISAVDALDELVDRLRAPGLDLVVLALKVSRRTGAPLGGLLADASHLVGERIELARRLEVKTAQVRMSARLVAGMPVLMAGALSLLSADFRAGVFTFPGACSLAIAFSLNVMAWSIIRAIMRVDL